MNILRALFVSLGIVFLMGGCETTTSTTKSKAPKDQIILQKGMSGAEIKELLGEPLIVRNNEGNTGSTETWIYEDSREFTRQVQAETREVPYTHPITRETTTIEEVVTKIKTDRITLTTELFISQGKLIGWKESTRESSSFQD